MIRILHLYYDLMNLYGENANVRCITTNLDRSNIKYKVDYLTIGDNIKFNKYDIVYIGMGSINNELIVLNDIMKYKSDIKEYISNNKVFISTGNSIELFGKSIITKDKEYKGLNIFNYYSKHESHISTSLVDYTNLIKYPVVAFDNRFGRMYDIDKPLFNSEGYHFNKFYGTYYIGPILIRNPHLINYILKDVKGYKIPKNTPELKAYKEYLNIYKIAD